MEKFEDGVSVKASGVVNASGDVHSEDIMQAVGDIIIEYKKSGSITTEVLLDKLEKYQATTSEIEEAYKQLEDAGIQVINEFERDKDLYDQILKEVSMDDPVKMYLKDIGKVPLLSPDEETDIPALLPMLAERYSEEFAFLRALPHVIETPHCATTFWKSSSESEAL